MSNDTEQDVNTTTEWTVWRVELKANRVWVGVEEHDTIDAALSDWEYFRKEQEVRLFKVTTTETRIK